MMGGGGETQGYDDIPLSLGIVRPGPAEMIGAFDLRVYRVATLKLAKTNQCSSTTSNER